MSVRRRSALLTLVIALFLTVLAACGSVGTAGSGATRSEARDTDGFTRVEVENGIGLNIQVGGVQTVEVLAQDSILPLIVTTVESGVLRIHSTESFTTTTVEVTVSMPALDGLSIGGGSQAQIDGLATDHLDIHLSGGAGLAATGRATNVTLDGSGGARADLATLHVKTMRVMLSEGATADVSVSDLLTGTASGGAAAKVAGASVLDVQTSGGASVTRN